MLSISKILNSGINHVQSVTERRYIRTTNIVALIAMGFMLIWVLIAATSIDNSLSAIVNGIGFLLFLCVLIFNRLEKPFLAASWLLSITYLQLLYQLYLYGNASGLGLICILIIIAPYVTIPRKARFASHIFALLGSFTWILITIYDDFLIARIHVFDPKMHLIINIALVSFTCLIFLSSLSNIIDRSEEFLDIERKKSDSLLHNILPRSIASKLKEDDSIIAHGYETVTVLFADIVGFTKLSEKLEPHELVVTLNDIFSSFDVLVEKYGLEKIKTIGDAYMVSAGLPEKDPNQRLKMGRFAIDINNYMKEQWCNVDDPLQIRIGIHSGPAVAGVIGIKKFAYDLWGDTVNTASRMESHGEPGKIHVTKDFFNATVEDFEYDKREPINVKGKGRMQTYYLTNIKSVANNG